MSQFEDYGQSDLEGAKKHIEQQREESKATVFNPKNAAEHASIICLNCFDELREIYNRGSMATHHEIALMSVEFEKRFGYLDDEGTWDEFVGDPDKNPLHQEFSDYEEFLCSWAMMYANDSKSK